MLLRALRLVEEESSAHWTLRHLLAHRGFLLILNFDMLLLVALVVVSLEERSLAPIIYSSTKVLLICDHCSEFGHPSSDDLQLVKDGSIRLGDKTRLELSNVGGLYVVSSKLSRRDYTAKMCCLVVYFAFLRRRKSGTLLHFIRPGASKTP